MANKGSENGGKKVPSKQWSCSELERGHSKLLKVKHESVGEDELQQQIKESFRNSCDSCLLWYIDKSLSFPFFLGSVSQQPVFPGLRSPT